MKNLIKNLRICHRGKLETLDIKISGDLHEWDPYEDIGWLQYKKAREEIPPMIWKIFSFLKFV